MNEPGPYFDFLNNLYDKILKEQKNQKKFKCICGSNAFYEDIKYPYYFPNEINHL